MKKYIISFLVVLGIFVFGVSKTQAIAGIPGPCDANAPSSLKILSPNGGEVYSLNQQIPLSWTSCNIPQSAMITPVFSYIDSNDSGELIHNSGAGSLDKVLNTGSALITPPTSLLNNLGKHFKIKLVYDTSFASDPANVRVSDSSDDTFTINNSTTTQKTLGKISYWWGKYNLHSSNGVWVSDTASDAGAKLEMMTYCKRWFPNTTEIKDGGVEIASVWKAVGNYSTQTSVKPVYLCVESQPSGSAFGIVSANKNNASINDLIKVSGTVTNTGSSAQTYKTVLSYATEYLPENVNQVIYPAQDYSEIFSLASGTSKNMSAQFYAKNSGYNFAKISVYQKIGSDYKLVSQQLDRVTVTGTTVAPSITVLSPNGGETYTMGQSININWKTSNAQSGQTVSLSIGKEIPASQNNGISGGFSPLVSFYPYQIANDGSETVTLSGSSTNSIWPLTPGTNYKIIAVLNPLSTNTNETPYISDTSDSMFSINSSVALQIGDVNGDGIINCDDVKMIKEAFAGIITLTDEQYKRADVNGSGYVNSTDATVLMLKYNFSCTVTQPSITVLSPNGGETLNISNPITIKFKSSNVSPIKHYINLNDETAGKSYSLDSLLGSYGVTFSQAQINLSQQYITVTIPKTYNLDISHKYKIEILVNNISDKSDGFFTLTRSTVNPNYSVKVLSPNGGETLKMGEKTKIKWQDNKTSVCNVGGVCDSALRYYDISLIPRDIACTEAGVCPVKETSYVAYSIANKVTGNSFNWKVGEVLNNTLNISNTSAYTVLICRSGTGVCDSSDSYFKITSSNNSSTPVISGVSGPQTLSESQTGTWIVKAYDPKGGNLSYSVDWGDNIQFTYCPSGGGPCSSQSSSKYSQQSATFTHSYAQTGNYTPKFTVTNSNGQSASTSLSVNVGNIVSTPSVKVLLPNGGEAFKAGEQIKVTWATSSGVSKRENVWISMYDSSKPVKYVDLVTKHTLNDGGEVVTIPKNTSTGNYKIRVDVYGVVSTNDLGTISDSSDNSFTITAPVTPQIGDVNGDGIINCDDVKMIKEASAGIITLTNEQYKRADVNSSGYVNATDATVLMLRNNFSCPVAQPSITILSPNGGETYTAGQQIAIKWESKNIPANAVLSIDSDWIQSLGPNFHTTSLNDGMELFTIPSNYVGQFRITISTHEYDVADS